MIYTFGDRKNYHALFKEADVRKLGGLQKKGRSDTYQGGTVFQTFEDAKAYSAEREEYDVFGVLADWETQTEPNRNGHPFHDLLVDAEIVMVNQETGDPYA